MPSRFHRTDKTRKYRKQMSEVTFTKRHNDEDRHPFRLDHQPLLPKDPADIQRATVKGQLTIRSKKVKVTLPKV